MMLRHLALLAAILFFASTGHAAVVTVGGGPGAPLPDRATQALLCTNSLVQCDPKHVSYTKGWPDALTYWIIPAQGDAPACSSGEIGGCGAGALDWHNPDANAAKGSVRGRPVTIPTGVTSIRLRLKYLRQHPIIGATGAVTLQLLAWDGVTSVGSGTCSVPAAPAPINGVAQSTPDCTVGPITVTAGLEYIAQIAVNPSGTQSSFLAGRFAVEPVASSVAFWSSNFVRLDADGMQWGVNPLPGTYSNPRRPDALAYSEIKVKASAPTLMVETAANIWDYISNLGTVDARASFTATTGTTTVTIVPENNGGSGASARRVQYSSVANTTAGGSPSAVTLRSGQHALRGYPAPAAEEAGVFFAAVYAPASSYLEVQRPPRPYAALAFDSKGEAHPSSPATSLAGLIRARGYEVDSWTVGGDTLLGHVSSSLDAATLEWARLLTAHNPALVFLELSRNDKIANGTSDATIYGRQQVAFDALSKVGGPRVRIVGITKEGSDSIDATRAAIQSNACAGTAPDGTNRSILCSVARADGIWSASECQASTCVDPSTPCADKYCACGASRCAADKVHLADAGYERLAELLSGERYPLPSALLSSNTLGWWEADYGVSGGTAGSVTSGGTSPPSVTVTGTATRAVRVRAEVASVSGSAGLLRISYDGGKSWPEQGVAFATTGQTIALPVTAGLTSLGLSLVFPSGSYNNLHTYYFDTQGGAWADLSGHSNALGLVNASTYVTWSASNAAYNGQPSTTTATSHWWSISGLSVAPPYAIVFVGALDATSSSPYFGRTGSTAGLLLYATSSTTIALNDGGGQITSGTTTPTSPHCIVADYRGSGANSTIYIDGVVSGTPGKPGNNNTLTNLSVGYDPVNALTAAPTVVAMALISGGVTADDARSICWRYAFKDGTP